jgi:hypothetical protein
MNDEFYATVKLTTGEEILGIILVQEHGIYIENPLVLEDFGVLEELFENSHVSGIKLSRWIKATTDDVFYIQNEKIVTVGELKDPGLSYYMRATKEIKESNIHKINESYSKKQKYNGYRCSIKKARSNFEDLFKNY